MMRILIVYGIILFLNSSATCNSQDLSRNHAARLIKQNDDFINRQFILPYHSQGLEKAQNQEYVTPTGRLTSKGTSYFVQAHSYALEVSEPVETKLTITGIRSETTHIRIAEFNWTYIDMPAKACRFVVQGGKGSAFFQLYDDGWRVWDVTMSTHYRRPCVMTEARRLEEQAEIEAMVESVRLEEERIRNAVHARFQDNHDGTVTDLQTGLTWIQKVFTGEHWNLFKVHFERLDWAGHSDWRMPSRREIQTLINDQGWITDTDTRDYFPHEVFSKQRFHLLSADECDRRGFAWHYSSTRKTFECFAKGYGGTAMAVRGQLSEQDTP